MTTSFIRLLATFVVASALCAEPTSRPNVLWIIADDLSPDLACYGEPTAAASATPHLDALAKEGVRFTNVFGTASVCSPNRSGFNTGMYQTSIGAQNHRTLVKRPLPDGVVTIPELFRQAGYFVSNGRPSSPDEAAGQPLEKVGKLDWNFEVPGEPFDGVDWSQRAPGQPFFAQVNIDEPHRTWTRDMRRPVDPSKVELPPYYPEHPVLRVDWSRYLEEVQLFDRQVGAILKRLEREGLADNTVVLVFGDNGRSFPRDKGYLYDGGLRVPLIMRWADGRNAGQVDERLISMIDLGPTCLDIAGVTLPDYLQGRSFADDTTPGRERVFSAKDRTGVVPDRIRSVRTTELKYIRNFTSGNPYLPTNDYTLLVEPAVAVMMTHHERTGLDDYVSRFVGNGRPAEELYDIRADPNEMNNLAGDARFTDTLATFRQQLNDWVAETGDLGVHPEDPAEIAPYGKWLDGYLGKLRRRMGVSELTAPTMYSYWLNKYDLL
ncbi:sulfatase family protein [Synoicihabitans lomoniglobus]|uniref:Sulfatase n=1 Tax=Synoicihabitans lomoniglobus TaxID=2909285 RepID=A0AAF0CMG2_9BACT|nr:sulfatase [Opitutaceae bacterium LMO-M01]WED64068.1 sulfatase [Opitutaceae bacterium LMO-M01]